ncbi:MAG: tRNA (adenosine(37)-N6)-threonylcarbamoyltransferase complex dimerization subunit type 1 TsaB [Marinisporobacter sp.]|jgi:tRNA threonylcarbamoyladenosine biosynthesis protein TsaB|nr:tRNA (adenosine(37)-N6)-threonylcarbamoyltransferase complex dimerization subunit type 1 TsaB [Marinisporobacter sp.]
MKILALDTSSIVATVAVMDDDQLIGEYIINHKRTHSQKLMPMIEELLKSCELAIKDMDIIAVAKGPGSFTGLRIGVATAKGLAHAVDIPVVGISTLDALAFNMPFSEGIICPILDARRSQVYTAVYKWDDETLNNIEEPIAISIEELVEKLLKRPEKVVFLGDGIKANKEYLIEKLKDRAVFPPNSVKMQRASSVAQLAMERAKNGEVENYYELVPTYLRKSEAERQYEEKMKRCGECES